MSMTEGNTQDILIQKLDGFIRKYYKNQLIRGLIYFLALFLVFFLSIAVLEYFGHFGIAVRTSMFYSFLVINAGILVRYVVIPLAKLYKVGTVLSHDQAAIIIGSHFREVNDKLVNALQLRRLAAKDGDTSLLLASIEQKTVELRPVPFTAAIDLKENRKKLKFILIPLFSIAGILLLAPSVLMDGTRRIVSHGTYFEPQAPFSFAIENNELLAVEGEDFELNVKMSGQEIPESVYILLGGVEYKMTKVSDLEFRYIFKAPRKDVEFKLSADGFFSSAYMLHVVPKPQVMQMEMKLEYPAYLHMKDEVISNRGDVTVPQGTRVVWQLNTRNSEHIAIIWNDTILRSKVEGDKYSFSNRLMADLNYAVVAGNSYIPGRDTIHYAIKVIPDLFPSVEVHEQLDSIFVTRLMFNGEVSDDYGLRKLVFHYRKEKQGEQQRSGFESIVVPITNGQTRQSFFHAFDTKTLDLELGDRLVYYFEVWDNDGVNGSKSSRTSQRIYSLPTKEEVREKIENTNESIKSDLSDNINAINELQKEIKDLNKSMLQKKELTWDDKNKMEKLLEKQKEIQDKLKETQEKNEINNLQKDELNEQEQRILEKQQEVDKLFEKLDNDDLKKMLDELDKMMEKMDKNKLQNMLDQMKLTNEDLEKELDRTLEIFKQMEFEQKLDDIVKQLDDLQKEQDKLSEDTKNKSENNDKLEQRQDEIDKKFEQLKEDMKKLEELNNGLENQHQMEDTKQEQQDIDQQMEDAKQQLNQNQNNKSSQSQKNASKKMGEMKEKMEQMQQQMQSDSNMENLEDLRQILDNLLKLSFDQEELLENAKTINKNNPQYKDLMKTQHKLIDDSKIIEDSLLALSKRMIQLESFVNKEISAVKNNMESALDFLEDRNSALANQKQQYALTSINNLALMLSEAIDQMQQQMMQQMQQKTGNSSCNKPGMSNPNMNGLLKRQQGLQQKMNELQGKMQGEKQGQGEQNGKEGELNKELVKLAAEQESIRNDLQQLMNSMNQDQRKLAQDIVKKMEENETDLLNKRITSETVKRQNDITIKMMESEKALREQDQDEKRKSNEGEDKIRNNNDKLEEYMRRKQQELELLKTIPPAFKPYYKTKVSSYFNHF